MKNLVTMTVCRTENVIRHESKDAKKDKSAQAGSTRDSSAAEEDKGTPVPAATVRQKFLFFSH